MQMQKEWAAFKVTGFLYGIVLLLGFNFYLIHTAFDTIKYQVPNSNLIYITSALSVLFALYSIYFVRLYIKKQMKKHSIHDHDTHLFNKKYFLAELHTSVARAKRENNPLSMFSLFMNNFNNYDKKQQKHLAQKVAHMLSTVCRESDIACRYDEGYFAVLMPLTDNTQALHLEERMKEALNRFDFNMTPKPEFSLKTTQLDDNETEEDFVARSKR